MDKKLADLLEQHFELTELLLRAIESDEQELIREYARLLRILDKHINKLMNDAS